MVDSKYERTATGSSVELQRGGGAAARSRGCRRVPVCCADKPEIQQQGTEKYSSKEQRNTAARNREIQQNRGKFNDIEVINWLPEQTVGKYHQSNLSMRAKTVSSDICAVSSTSHIWEHDCDTAGGIYAFHPLLCTVADSRQS